MPVVLIAQITDTHITTNGKEAHYLTAALARIGELQPRPAAVVLSGDTVDNGRHEQYAILRDLLARSAVPVYVVPGNHDRREPLRAVLPGAHFPGVSGGRVNFSVDLDAIRLIGLDTSEFRRPGGYLDPAGLAWLDACLGDAPEQPTLVFMHHPPFRTGVNAADMFGFVGLQQFHAIVARRPAVHRIVAGHIHCERRALIGQAVATTNISTAPQRVPELFERRIIGFRPEPAGFAVHAWNGDAFVSTTYVNARGVFVARPAGSTDPAGCQTDVAAKRNRT